jgi:hypothetical protein
MERNLIFLFFFRNYFIIRGMMYSHFSEIIFGFYIYIKIGFKYLWQDSRIHIIPNSNYPDDGNVKNSMVTIVEMLVIFYIKS